MTPAELTNVTVVGVVVAVPAFYVLALLFQAVRAGVDAWRGYEAPMVGPTVVTPVSIQMPVPAASSTKLRLFTALIEVQVHAETAGDAASQVVRGIQTAIERREDITLKIHPFARPHDAEWISEKAKR